MTTKPIMAYWFEPADGRLGYGDGRTPVVGETHEIDGEPVLCKRGLHASLHPFDALQYAGSAILWRVELSGEIAFGDDKIAGTRRTYLARRDAKEVLRKFARQCALDVLPLAREYYSDANYRLVEEYLTTGKYELRAAASAAAWAASDAASAAARAAASDAARAAARAAASDAAWAARAAASDAARAASDAASAAARAARAAASDAARAAASDAARAAARDAARDAAWAAAWAAAIERQRAALDAMIEELFNNDGE